MPRSLDVMPGFLSVQELHSCTRIVSDMLVYSHKCFVDGLSDLISGPILICEHTVSTRH